MDFYLQYFSHFHYLGLFFVLVLCGVGFPIPEDVVIISGGYFAYLGYTRLFPTILVLYAGALVGDISLYWIGRRFGPDIIAHRRLTWFFTPKRVMAINHYFHKFGSHTLFFARFLLGLRATIFLSSGAFKIPFKKMLLFDGAAASISVPLITFLAYHFGGELDQFILWLRRVEHAAGVVVVIVVGIILLRIWHRLRGKKEEVMVIEPELEPPKDSEVS
jgi:membrane protein DedA with SNARE-associated domain